MEDYTKIKKKMDQLTIGEILETLDARKEKYTKARKEFILGLSYLERSGRYQEHKQYKNSVFEDFIWHRYSLRPGTYRGEQAVFNNFADEVEKFDVGVVRTITNKVDARNYDKVFKAIKPGEPLEKIKAKIDKFARPKPVSIPKPTAKENSLVSETHIMVEEIAEKDKQIAKLKVSVKRYKKESAMWEKKYMDLLSTLTPVWDIAQPYAEQMAQA